jgi:hypothetical protein
MSTYDLELCTDNLFGGDHMVGIFFPKVTLPRSIEVLMAYVQFDVDDVRDGETDQPIQIEISGEAVPSAHATAASYDLSSRCKTKTTVLWAPEPSIRKRDSLVTVDVSSIITEIVGTAQWTAGSSLGLFFHRTGGSGVRLVERYSPTGTATPSLLVKFDPGAKPHKLVPTPSCPAYTFPTTTTTTVTNLITSTTGTSSHVVGWCVDDGFGDASTYSWVTLSRLS